MYCNKCGKKIEEDSTFCEYCGNKVKNDLMDNIKSTTKQGIEKSKELAKKVEAKIPLETKENVKKIESNFSNMLPPAVRKYKMAIYIGVPVILLICLILVCVLLFGGKTLKCSYNTTFSGMSTDMSVVMKFKKDRPRNVKLMFTIDVSDLDKDEIEDGVDNIKEQMERLEDDGIKVSVKSNQKKISVTLSGDYEAINDNILNYDDDDSLSYKEIRKSAKSSGWTCK